MMDGKDLRLLTWKKDGILLILSQIIIGENFLRR